MVKLTATIGKCRILIGSKYRMKGKTIMKPRSPVVSIRMMLLVTLVLLTSMTVKAVSTCIPEGASVNSATFSAYVRGWGQTINLHRITAPWIETEVTWNNFGGSYVSAVEGSFIAPYGSDWCSVNVASLVQGWVDGSYPNYGLLLEQGQASAITCASSEYGTVELRPQLEICYTTSSGLKYVTIQRPGSEQDGVADAYIYELSPDRNAGNSTVLYVGPIRGYEKQSLVRFELEFCEEPAGCRFTGGGVDTDGNWDHSLEDGEMVRNGAGNLPEGIDRAQFGGQAGANTGQPPQPKGEWTHHQQTGPSGRFTFHGGTASAPEGTEIVEIRCSDPGGCKPSGDPPSPAKQLDFDGVGTFKSIGKGSKAPTFEIDNPNVTAEGRGNKEFNGTFHWFEVNIDDLGEPGGLNRGAPDSEDCPGTGFGEKGTEPLANCDCPDFYRVTIYDGVNAADVVWLPDGSIDPASLLIDEVTNLPKEVIYEFYGYIDGGNLQIHRPTGFDLGGLSERWLASVK
jgi:hypothetical protein